MATKTKNAVAKKGNKNAFMNAPNNDENAYIFDTADDRRAYTRSTMLELLEHFKAKPVTTPEELEQRTYEYFYNCAERGIKPTWEEYAVSIGIDRTNLWRWETGASRPEMSATVKRAKDILAAFDAKAVIDGKLFPTTYIFRAKNYYGMKDQQDVVVTPNTLESRPAAELIREAELLPDD